MKLEFLFAFTTLLAFSEAASGPFLIPTKMRGPYKHIGMKTQLLTDKSRKDPYDPKHGVRNVLVHFFYPTTASHNKSSPYGPAGQLRGIETGFQLPSGMLNLLGINAEAGAPFDPSLKDLPLLLFSTGSRATGNTYTAMTAGLASHGYVVAAMDHPYDAAVLEYPDGTIVQGVNFTSIESYKEATKVRVADAKFVLDTLTKAKDQGKFIPGCSKSSKRSCGCYNEKNIGMYGHSMGGATTGDVTLTDRRVKGGINLDGMFLNLASTPTQPSLDGRPFLVMGTPDHNSTAKGDESWVTFKKVHKGKTWLRFVTFKEFQHLTYSDLPIVVDGAGFRALLPKEFLETQIGSTIGTINGLRAEEIVDAYVSDFFNFALKGKKSTIANGPNKNFPEATFED